MISGSTDLPAPPQTEPEDGGPHQPGGAIRIGDFVFVPESGELCPTTGAPFRLAPKPARLLTLLIRKQDGVLSREEIRRNLWPDVLVDFDQGLHFCVRQLRTAFGDSAKRSEYIETLPRRGYRLLVEAQPVELRPAETTDNAAGTSQTGFQSSAPGRAEGGSAGRWGASKLAAIGATVLAALVFGLLIAEAPSSDSSSASPAPELAETPRLAIMSFRAPESASVDSHRIADLLLVRLGSLGVDRLAVIGPSTTAAYGTDLDAVGDFARNHEVDFVVNGRWITQDDGSPRLLAEVIRTTDGAHLFVRSFDPLVAFEAITEEIAQGIEETLELP